MKRALTILTIGLFIFCECQNTKKLDKDATTDDNSKQDSPHRTSEQILDSDSMTVLYKKSFSHKFSSNVTADSFNVYLIGKNIPWGLLKLEVKNANGEIIYTETSKASNIWDVEMYTAKKDVKEKYVLNFIDKSFNKENFFSPVIKPTDVFNEYYSDKKIWDELKADKTAIGFSYSMGYENGGQIAYVKSLKKAVKYFDCC